VGKIKFNHKSQGCSRLPHLEKIPPTLMEAGNDVVVKNKVCLKRDLPSSKTRFHAATERTLRFPVGSPGPAPASIHRAGFWRRPGVGGGELSADQNCAALAFTIAKCDSDLYMRWKQLRNRGLLVIAKVWCSDKNFVNSNAMCNRKDVSFFRSKKYFPSY